MKLPIPFEFQGRVINEIDIKRPNTDAIADCKDKIRDTGLYSGMSILALGSIASLIDDSGSGITEKNALKNAILVMPYRDIEFALLQAFLKTGIDDVIEGIYPCPRCKLDYIPGDPDPEYDKNDPEHNVDDADHISKLKIIYLEKPREFDIELETSIETIDATTDEVIESVTHLKLRDPNMDDMIRAERKAGTTNAERLNAAIFTECTTEINGQKVDKKWKAEWGTWLYERIDFSDSGKIGAEIRKYGVKASVERVCRKCGRKWEAEVDTGSFFASGLGV